MVAQFHKGTQSCTQRETENEPVAMDTTCGPVGHPAITHGSIHAQFFHRSEVQLQNRVPCDKSDKDVHRCILDEIRKLGAMDVLVSEERRHKLARKFTTHCALSESVTGNRNRTTRIRITQSEDGGTPSYF